MDDDERAGLQSVITEVMTDKDGPTFEFPADLSRLLSKVGVTIPHGRVGRSGEISEKSPQHGEGGFISHYSHI
jgi:hypothetical protein